MLVLITDGEDTVKGWQYNDAIEQAQRAGAMVYALIIVPIAGDAGQERWRGACADPDGRGYWRKVLLRRRSAGPGRGAGACFRRPARGVRYVLGYYAPERRPSDEAFRPVQVTLTNANLAKSFKLRYRSGYYADTKVRLLT